MTTLPFTTGTIKPELAAVLLRLQEGQRLRITQTVRVGSKTWQAVVTGTAVPFTEQSLAPWEGFTLAMQLVMHWHLLQVEPAFRFCSRGIPWGMSVPMQLGGVSELEPRTIVP